MRRCGSAHANCKEEDIGMQSRAGATPHFPTHVHTTPAALVVCVPCRLISNNFLRKKTLLQHQVEQHVEW